MVATNTEDVTGLLLEWRAGDRRAAERLMSTVYDELRRIAGSFFSGRGDGDQTMQPTALVNEAYLRLIEQNRVEWRDRAHFFAIAAKLMRRIWCDDLRRRSAKKRGGDGLRVSMSGLEVALPPPGYDPLALDEALRRLAEQDPDKARIVELRFFGGLTVREVAEVLGCSRATVERHWELARSWLYRELR